MSIPGRRESSSKPWVTGLPIAAGESDAYVAWIHPTAEPADTKRGSLVAVLDHAPFRFAGKIAAGRA